MTEEDPLTKEMFAPGFAFAEQLRSHEQGNDVETYELLCAAATVIEDLLAAGNFLHNTLMGHDIERYDTGLSRWRGVVDAVALLEGRHV